jgi:RNA polymerase sigma-70 factor (ECF subfamily)
MPRRIRLDPSPLLAKAKQGDPEALGQLLESYRSYLGLLARLQVGRWLQGRLGSSDLVQDTFLAAQRDFVGFEGQTEAELLAWLRRILANRLVDSLRKNLNRGRSPRLERRIVDDLGRSSHALNQNLVDPNGTPSQQAIQREQGVALAEAIQQLPDAYREVIILSHLEGLKFPDVARRMGRSVDSVKNLWARGLARLRRILGERT